MNTDELEKNRIRIGSIGNHVGKLLIPHDKKKSSCWVIENRLFISHHNQNSYWGIENSDGVNWELIPYELYNTLMKFMDHALEEMIEPEGELKWPMPKFGRCACGYELHEDRSCSDYSCHKGNYK